MKHSPIMTLGFAACLLMIAGTLSADTVENPLCLSGVSPRIAPNED